MQADSPVRRDAAAPRVGSDALAEGRFVVRASPRKVSRTGVFASSVFGAALAPGPGFAAAAATTSGAASKTVIQTNDVDLDYRGLAYISDRAGTGLHIVEYLG